MSKRLKLNVLNIVSGYQNLNDVFSGQETRIYNGFARLVVPRSIALRRPDCKYYQQDYVKRTTRKFSKLILSEPFKKTTVTRKFSHLPLTGKWLTTAHTCPTVTPGSGFPWRTSYSFYYDVKDPKCPPPDPKPTDPCARLKQKKPVCPKPKCNDDPCGKCKPNPCKPNPCKPNPCKPNPCKRQKCTFTVPMKLCRFYSTSKCPGSGGGCGGCKKKCGGGGSKKGPCGGSGGRQKPKRCGGGQKPKRCGGGSKASDPCGARKGRSSPCGSKGGGEGKGGPCGSGSRSIPERKCGGKGGGSGGPIKPKCG